MHIGKDDHLDVTNYLDELDKTHIYNLGMVLGLGPQRLRHMSNSNTFLDDVISGWLQRLDQVDRRGVPSWTNLVKALQHRRVGHNGIASKIAQDKRLSSQPGNWDLVLM